MSENVKKIRPENSNLDTTPPTSGGRYSLRQDRINSTDFESYLITKTQKSFNILDISPFGLAIFSTKNIVFDEADLYNCKIVVNNLELITANLRLVRAEAIHTAGYRIAFEVVNNSIPVEKLALIPEITKSLNSLDEFYSHINNIPDDIKVLIFKFLNYLNKLQHNLNILENTHKQSFTSIKSKEEFENLVIESYLKVVSGVVKNFSDEIEENSKKYDSQLIKKIFEFIREESKSLLYQSPFLHRSLNKPQGYAGDFEMMNLIYRNESQGPSLFHKCIEKTFLNHSESIAVRNRIDFLKNKIIEKNAKNKKILSLASGPAMEIQRLIEELPQNELELYEFHLLDQDILALKYAQRQITNILKILGKKANIQYHQKNIKQIFSGNFFQPEYFDTIYSAGLFDYFSDDIATLITKKLLKVLAKNGKLIIGNFNISAPGSAALKYILDWNLIYRNRDDLKRIFGVANTELNVESEPAEINLFAIIKKCI